MADELEVDQTTPETPAEATPPPTQSPAPAATSTPPPAQTTPIPAPSTPAYESARDFASKALGYKADTYSDDESFLRAVVAGEQTLRRQLAEAQQYVHLYHQQQQQQPKPAPAEKPDPFARYKAPEFNQAWLAQVERTETGGLRLKEGADPSILPKLHAYQQYQAEVAQKMTTDPIGYLREAFETIAAEKAQAVVQEQLQRAQGDHYVNSFLQNNAGWLLQQDSQGRVVQNPATGQAMLTPAGGRFLHFMQEAERYGITNPAAQEAYATNGLKAELYAPAAQGSQAVTEGDKQKQALLQSMNRNKSGSMTPPEAGGPPVQNESLSLGQRLLRVFEANGVKDSDFAAA